MVMYEMWWVRYFRSERRLSDFYGSFSGDTSCRSNTAGYCVLYVGNVWKSCMDVNISPYFGDRSYRYTYSAQNLIAAECEKEA